MCVINVCTLTLANICIISIQLLCSDEMQSINSTQSLGFSFPFHLYTFIMKTQNKQSVYLQFGSDVWVYGLLN